MNQEQFYRIEAYLRGEMPASEKTAFEAELATNPALAEQLAAQQAQRLVAEIFIEDELRAEAQKWRADLENEPAQPSAPGKNVRLWWWVAIGAAASLLILLYVLFLSPLIKVEPETPIADKEAPDTSKVTDTPPDTSSVKTPAPVPKNTPLVANVGDDPSAAYSGTLQPLIETALKTMRLTFNVPFRNADSTGQWFKTAKDLFDQKKYYPAVAYLKKIQRGNQYYREAQYNMGCIYFAEDKYQEAIPPLRFAASGAVGEFLYADEAQWYLTLALMKTGDIEEAEQQIADLLQNPGGDFFKKAESLRDDIAGVQKNHPPTDFIAANFEPNDRMDAYTSLTRSDGPKAKLSSPANGADFPPDKKGKVIVRFAGVVEGVPERAAGTFVIKIFNNRDSDTPQTSWPLEVKKDAAGLRFDASQPLQLSRGLYYFSIEQAGDRLYTGKFTVGKPDRK